MLSDTRLTRPPKPVPRVDLQETAKLKFVKLAKNLNSLPNSNRLSCKNGSPKNFKSKFTKERLKEQLLAASKEARKLSANQRNLVNQKNSF